MDKKENTDEQNSTSYVVSSVESEFPSTEDIESTKVISGYNFGEIKAPPVAKKASLTDSDKDAPTPEDIRSCQEQLAQTANDPNLLMSSPHFITDGAEKSTDAPFLTSPEDSIKEPDEDENRIENRPLDSYTVNKVVGAIKLEPLIVFIEVNGKEDNEAVGVPGFFDSTNERFVLLDGSPVPSKGFDKKFSEYVKMRKSEQT